MKNNEMVRINELTFKFDEIALTRDFDLVHVSVRDYNNISLFWNIIDKMDILAVTCIKKLKYAILLKKGKFKNPKNVDGIVFTKASFTYFDKSARIYRNNILQLFFNQLSDDTELIPEKNNTVDLFIHKTNWDNVLSNGIKQIYALKIKINWKEMLVASVVTFTQNLKEDSKTELFYLNKERGVIGRDYHKKSAESYKIGNLMGKNLVDFISLIGLKDYEQSKVGIVNNLLNNMRDYFGQYFIQIPSLKDIPTMFDFEKPKSREKNIWNYFKNSEINLYFDEKNEKLKDLGNQVICGYRRSEILNAHDIDIVKNDYSSDGLNIQVIRDVRKDDTIPEEYELGIRKKIIQHISPDGFGEMDYKGKKVKWEFDDKKDIADDTRVINLFQNLAIKQDLVNKRMDLVNSDLIGLVSKYQFFFFDFSIKNKVIVDELIISKDRKMHFISKRLNPSKLDLSDELSLVYSFVQEREKLKHFYPDQIECVIKVRKNYILIVQTEMQVLPMQEIIAEREKNADINRKLSKKRAIENLKYLDHQIIHSNNRDYASSDLQVMIDCINELEGPIITVGEIKKGFKVKKQISFRKKSFRRICNDLEELFGYTYNSSTRQTKPNSLFPGFKGIGLINNNDDFYYYVGGEKNLKQKISRAIRFRKIIALTGSDDLIVTVFPDLAELMSVKFVRNGQYTVLPFPIKYLREFSEYQKRLSEMNRQNDL